MPSYEISSPTSSLFRFVNYPFKYVLYPLLYVYSRMLRFTFLFKLSCISYFPREFDCGITIPFMLRLLVSDQFLFLSRSDHEFLLIELIFKLLINYELPNSPVIVDIGSWISDNSLVWAKAFESRHVKVLAIDP